MMIATDAPLTSALRAVRLEATMYFHAELAGPWGMAIREGLFANFHIVTGGGCWVRGGGPPLHLAEGDLVVFPTGVAHALSGSEHATLMPAEEMLPTIQDSGCFGEGAVNTELICGHFDLFSDRRHPLFRGLPERIHLRGEGTWVRTATELAASGSRHGGPASGAIVDRLAEALLIEILRRHAASSPAGVGSLAGLAHPSLGRALEAIHSDYAANWSLEQLAQRAGMSRTAFAVSFRETIGEPPLTYLTQWRLATACGLLRDGLTLDEVADRVGYGNAFSFSKAFKREYGVAPSAWRRQAG